LTFSFFVGNYRLFGVLRCNYKIKRFKDENGKMKKILEDYWYSFVKKYGKSIRSNVKAEVYKVFGIHGKE